MYSAFSGSTQSPSCESIFEQKYMGIGQNDETSKILRLIWGEADCLTKAIKIF